MIHLMEIMQNLIWVGILLIGVSIVLFVVGHYGQN